MIKHAVSKVSTVPIVPELNETLNQIVLVSVASCVGARRAKHKRFSLGCEDLVMLVSNRIRGSATRTTLALISKRA
jgi:hypothetical protein